MHLRLIVTFAILLSQSVLTHCYQCTCSCCLGSGCLTMPLPDPVEAQQCTSTSCLAACKARYYQCTAPLGQGYAVGTCSSATTGVSTPSSIIAGPYACQCKCCNTGTYQCTTSFVGWTNAYSCTEGACSISCTNNYPNSCVSNQNGRTEGTCIGTSSSTTNSPNRSVRCGCTCYGSNGIENYEVSTSYGCSGCLAACQSIRLQCHSHQYISCNNS